MAYNQRNYIRIAVDFAVTVAPDSGEPFEATMVDLSAGGVRIESTVVLASGVSVVCTFFDDTYSCIEVQGTTCSVANGGFGVHFTGYDTVSHSYLKGLLLARADDPHAVEEEFLLNLDQLPIPD